MLEYQRHANEVRARLRNPPNAVPDSAWIGKCIVPEAIREERVPVVPIGASMADTFFHKRCLEFFNASVASPITPPV
jgi:hypothetical protein